MLADLSPCGFEADTKGAVASNPLFARSIEAWEEAAHGWVEDPDRDRGLMLLCVVVESDPVWGATTAAERISSAFARSPKRDLLLRRLAQAALAARPPTGFRRQRVLFWGEERKALDIKKAGCCRSRRWRAGAACAAGVGAASTRARIEASEAAGTLSADDAAILRDAFELVCELRMEHQVDQLRSGQGPTT